MAKKKIEDMTDAELFAAREAIVRPPKGKPPPPTQPPSIVASGEVRGLSELARSACHWIERFCHVDDEGTRFRLYPAQVKFLKDVYRTDRNGNRITKVAVWSVGRGNGKSSTAAAITLHDMTAKGCARGGHWFLSAKTKEQSGIIYDYILRMIARSPQLRSRYEVAPSARRLVNTGNLNALQALGWNPGATQGRRPTGWVSDEAAEHRDGSMISAMTQAATKATRGVGLIVSTNNTAPGNVLLDHIDMIRSAHSRGELKDHIIHLHAPDLTKKGQGIWTDRALRMANPGLEGNPPLLDWDILTAARVRAKHSPLERTEYIARRLNASSGITSALIDPMRWATFGVAPTAREGARHAHLGRPCVLGLDLSSVTDMSAVVALFPEDGYVESMAWLPSETIEEAEIRDKAPYADWRDAGWLRTSAGRVVDYGEIAEYVIEAMSKWDVRKVRYDPYLFPNLKSQLTDRGLDCDSDAFLEVWEPFRQGYKSYTPAIVEIKRRIETGALVHLGDPVLSMAMVSVQVESPPNQAGDAYRPVKASRVSRIDPAVALIMASLPYEEEAAAEGTPSYYLDAIGA